MIVRGVKTVRKTRRTAMTKEIDKGGSGWSTESRRAVKIDEIRCDKAVSDGEQTKTERAPDSRDNCTRRYGFAAALLYKNV